MTTIEKKEHRRGVRAAWRAKNRDRIRAQSRDAYWANREHHLAKHKKWRQKPEVAQRLRDRARDWAKNHMEAHLSRCAVRRSIKRKSMKMADAEAIKLLYALAAERSKETGLEHAVDHIIPLNGKNVCGLHVEWNLQIITRSINASKYNRLPDESEHVFVDDFVRSGNRAGLTRAVEGVTVAL